MHSRYWGWLALKVVAVLAISLVCTLLVYALTLLYAAMRLSVDGILVAWFLILPAVSATLWRSCFRDQRHRCRVCGKRLRMPLSRGRWSALLLDTPETEYVCPYGCGKLLEQVSLSRFFTPQWSQYGDMWEELFRPAKPERR